MSYFIRRFVFCLFVLNCSLPEAPCQAIPSELKPYTHCAFPDGLEIVATDPLAGGVTARSVDTAVGKKLSPMIAGVRIGMAYPNTDFFANVKAEKLPAEYAKLKLILIENFEYLHGSSPSFQLNRAIASLPRELDVHGMDSSKLEGSTLGFYVMFDEKRGVVVTAYLLNQEPPARKFQTMDEYRKIRDHFLSAYTACIVNNQ